jgi:hypothetical protein
MPCWGTAMLGLDRMRSGMSAIFLVLAGEIGLDICMVVLQQREQIHELPLSYGLTCEAAGAANLEALRRSTRVKALGQHSLDATSQLDYAYALSRLLNGNTGRY